MKYSASRMQNNNYINETYHVLHTLGNECLVVDIKDYVEKKERVV